MTRVPLPRLIAVQAQAELMLTLQRGESVLVTLIIPVVLLVFFSSVPMLPQHSRTISVLLSGTLALAVISSGLVSLGIATAYERYYGVLKRLGLTPLSRTGLVAAKLLSVLALETIQAVVLMGIAAALYGWRPSGSLGVAVAAVLLGTAAFAGLGLLMAGTLRAEVTLAGTNALFLFFVLLGGLYVQLHQLPPILRDIAGVLPASPLASVLRYALNATTTFPAHDLVILALWAVALPALAVRSFRWQ